MALKMKDDNLSDDKSSLQASVLVFFILSIKSYWAILSRTFTVSVTELAKAAFIMYGREGGGWAVEIEGG